MKYRITDQQTGKTLVISGDSPPTKQEAEQLFQQSGIREQVQQQPQQQGGFLQSKVLPVGGGLLGGIIGGFAGPATGIAGAGAGYAGGDVIRKNLMNLLGASQTQTPVESVVETTTGAGKMAGLEALGIGAGKLVGKGIGMIPTKAKLGQKQLGEAGKLIEDLDIKKMLKLGDKYSIKYPIMKKAWEESWRPALASGKMSATEMIDLLKVYGHLAYTAAGDVKSKAESTLLNALYGTGREVLKEQAPQVAKYTPQMKTLYDLPKDIQRATWLSSKVGFTANMLKNLLGL